MRSMLFGDDKGYCQLLCPSVFGLGHRTMESWGRIHEFGDSINIQ